MLCGWSKMNKRSLGSPGDVNRLVSHCKDFGFYSGPSEELVVGFEQRRDIF